RLRRDDAHLLRLVATSVQAERRQAILAGRDVGERERSRCGAAFGVLGLCLDLRARSALETLEPQLRASELPRGEYGPGDLHRRLERHDQVADLVRSARDGKRALVVLEPAREPQQARTGTKTGDGEAPVLARFAVRAIAVRVAGRQE